MKYIIAIEAETYAFEHNPNVEVARLLRDLAHHIETDEPTYCTLRDLNGNKVGELRVLPGIIQPEDFNA